jgi:hypothetical protein
MSATIACPIASPTCVRAITAYLTDIHVDETYDFFAAKSILIWALGSGRRHGQHSGSAR